MGRAEWRQNNVRMLQTGYDEKNAEKLAKHGIIVA
jgi:hypothetical protein